MQPPAQAADLGRVPLTFEQNNGQTAGNVRFLSRGDGSTLYLTCSQAVLQLTAPQTSKTKPAQRSTSPAPIETAVLRMSFGDSENPCRAAGLDVQPGRAHYFQGRSAANWITNVPLYAKVRYSDVYPGTDLVFYGNQRRIEYDFVVAPGADPSRIRLTIEGAAQLAIDDAGQLVASVGSERIIQHKPFVYQPAENAGPNAGSEALAPANVDGRWKLLARNTVGFELGAYDRNRPLVIDPVIVYSTYLNGSENSYGFDIAVDDQGASYIVGETTSVDFPVTAGVVQPLYEQGSRNGFVTKLNPAGNQIAFSTFLGSGLDSVYGVDVDPQGNVYVTGDARSNDFPVTPGAFDSDPGGNTVFAAKLSPDGSQLIYSTFVGDGETIAGGIAVDGEGFAYIAGQTTSPTFPVVNAVQPQEAGQLPDAFITKLNQDGSALVFSTYYGGGEEIDTAEAIAIDQFGAVYVTGSTEASDFPTTPGAFQRALRGVRDAFLLKLDPSGAQVVYATLLGGDNRDWGHDVAVDVFGHAYVTGETNTTDGTFPVTAGALKEEPRNVEGFVTKFSPDGSDLVYSTFVGGARNEALYGIAVDTAGHAYVGGETTMLDEIETRNAIPGAEGVGGRSNDAAIFAKLSTDGSRALTFLGFGGGDGIEQANAIAIDGDCQAYMTGQTGSTDFVTVNAVQSQSTADDSATNGFVTKIDPSVDDDEPSIGCRGMVEATGTPVLREGAANSIMTVYGRNFAAQGTQALVPQLDANGRLVTRMADTCVEVNGIRSPLFAVYTVAPNPDQINFQNPHQLAPGYASFRVISGCGTANERYSEPEHILIREAAPAFFNFVNNADGVNPIAAVNESTKVLAGPSGLFAAVVTAPVRPGDYVSLYGTGFGATNPPFEAGQVPPTTDIARLVTTDVQVTIGGIELAPEDISYIGIAPGSAGQYQLVVRIPPNAPSGNLAVVLTIQGRSTPPGPFIAVQAQ